MPRVVGDDGDPGVGVGMVWVVLPSELNDYRIDLDRVDLRRAMSQRGRDVGPWPAPSTSTFWNVSPNTMYGHW